MLNSLLWVQSIFLIIFPVLLCCCKDYNKQLRDGQRKAASPITSCCSTDSEKQHRCCQLPNKNIGRKPDSRYSLYLPVWRYPPEKIATFHFMGFRAPIQYMVPWAQPIEPFALRFDRFIRFRRAHDCDHYTDTQTTEHRNNRPHLMLCIAMRPKLSCLFAQ